MNLLKTTPLQKTIISAAVATALSLGSTTTQADIYEFSYANGGCTTLPAPLGSCSGSGDALFTMLTSAGAVLQNTSYPYWGDTTWGYGLRTQMGGSLSYDSTTRAGAAIISPFAFYDGGDAVASSITFTKQAVGNLMLAQMEFDWNSNPPINTEVVWDGSGFIAALPTAAIGSTIDCATTGSCATPASNLTKSTLPIGVVPIATSTFNVGGVVNGVGTPTLGIDDGIAGSPMDNGPFDGFNANFDFDNLTLAGYNDTTAPAVALTSSTMTIALGTPFDRNDPGAAGYVSCDDGKDGAEDLDTETNANISFTPGGDNPDGSVAGTYNITYTCTDNASRWAAITDDPNNPGNPTVPANNTSIEETLILTVNTTPDANVNYDQTLASDGTLVIDFGTTDITGSDLIATDADGDTMTFSSVSATTNGGAVTDNGTDLLYTPPSAYVGADSFTYTVNDGTIDSGTGTVNLVVTNVLPVAVADGASAQNSQTITIDLTANDSDYEDDINGVPLITLANISVTTQDADGSSVTDNTDGTVEYIAPATFAGNDSFTYQVQDANGGLSSAVTVTVAISAIPNTVPVANDVAYNTDAGTPLDITFASLSDTDGSTLPGTDADGDALIFTNVTSTTNATITGNDSGTLTYTPNDGYSDDATLDTFTFTVNDGKGGVSTTQTISMTVNEIVPVATDKAVSMLLGDVTLNIDLLPNVSDVEDDADGTALNIVTPATPSNGTAVAVGPADGSIDYTPTAVGVHTFTYTVTDSDGNVSPPATVTATVTAAPVTSDIALATDEDVALTTISLPNILIATDGDGDALTYDTFDAATTQGGEVTVNGTNDTLTYTPAENFNSVASGVDDTFTFSVTDGVNGSTGTSTVTMTVAAIDDAMVCQGANITTTLDTPALITEANLVGTCTDIDGPVTLLLNYTQPTNGVVTDDGANNLTYTPNTGYIGPDPFDFTASDGTGVGDTVYTVTMAVVDDPAIHVITGGNFTMLTSAGSLVGGATDVSGVFDERLICNIESCTDIAMTTSLASSQPFFDLPWTAHDIRVFSPGTYTFDSTCGAADIAAGTTDCGGATPISMTVANGQLGAHMLFDYGAVAPTPCGVATCDIDVAVVWNYNVAFGDPTHDGCAVTDPVGACDPTHTPTKIWNWASVDGDGAAGGLDSFGNPIRGVAMVDGGFTDFSANFNLNMTSGYTPPVANDDSTSTTLSTLVVVDVLANDVDAEDGAPPVGATVTLLTPTSTEGGTLVNNGDGTVDYTPTGALVDGNSDTFTYTITDVGGAVSNIATATIGITAVANTAPVANDVTFISNEDAVLNINITDVDSLAVAVATDAEFNVLTFATFDPISAQGGTVTVDGTNSILTYTPQADFNGTDTFTFTVNDGLGGSNVATMTITVNPVNDAVVCTDVTLATATDTPLTIVAATELITGCSDIDVGDTITFASAANPANGASSIVDNGDGTLTYTPETGLFGSDSFVFTATDGNGGDGTATATIQVGTVYGNFSMLTAAGNVMGGTNDVVFTWDGVSMYTDVAVDLASNMTIVSDGPTLFSSAYWYAHHVRVFGPGTYSFETDNTLCEFKGTSPDSANASFKSAKLTASADDIDATGCPGTGTASTVSMTVAAGQIGVHMLFDYNGTFDIDVVNVYDMNAPWNDATGQGDAFNDLWTGAGGASPDPLTDWGLVSRDVNGDGVNGSPMMDGPFIGFYANFNDAPGGTAPPPPTITTEVRNTVLGGGVLNWGVLLLMLPLISLLRRRNK